MILTADADTVRLTNRREAPNGWSTSFIGVNRNTIKPGETPPAEGALHPVAFLVEKRPGGITRPHFHRADQYQVVVGGSEDGGRVCPEQEQTWERSSEELRGWRGLRTRRA